MSPCVLHTSQEWFGAEDASAWHGHIQERNVQQLTQCQELYLEVLRFSVCGPGVHLSLPPHSRVTGGNESTQTFSMASVD